MKQACAHQEESRFGWSSTSHKMEEKLTEESRITDTSPRLESIPRQRRIGPGVDDLKFAVAPRTCDVLALRGFSTLGNLCGFLADRGDLFLLSFCLGLCLFVSDRCR